jgi:MFS family permease
LLETLRSRLAAPRSHALELAVICLLWQASSGVFLLSLVQQYLPHELDAHAAFPGYALAIYAAARFLLQTPAGWLADRLGRRRTLTAGIAICLPSVLLMQQVQDPTSFLAFSGLYGAGSAAIWPSIMAYVGDTGEPAVRGRTLNILNLSQLVGLGIGTMAGVTLTDYISYQAAFIACLAFNALALAFAYRGAREGGSAVARERGAPARRVLRKLLSPHVLLLAVIALLLSIGTTIQAPVVGTYASEVLETKMTVLGLMLLVPAPLAFLVALRLGRLTDKMSRQVALVGGLGVAALCYFALSQTSDPILAVNLVIIAGLAYAVSIPAWGAAALDATELGGRGLILGALATVQGVGGVAGQVVGGVTNAAWGPVAPFKVGALVLVAALLLAAMYLREHRLAPAPTAA